MSKTITFNVKLLVDGKEKIVSATSSTKDLEGAFAAAQGRVGRMNGTLINFNQKMDAARNGIETSVGALEKLNSKLKSVRQQYAQASQMMGVEGEELKKANAQAQAIADTFGGEYGEVLVSANSLMKGFGISAEEALKLVKDGFVGGANVNGEFLDTLKEYPRYFKEAGISAEEFIAITANAAKQGIYSDKGVDTIKEGNLRIREMTKATAEALDNIGISSEEVQRKLQDGSMTTFQVMQMVGAKLAELPASSAKVGAAIADIFGGPGEDAGLEYIKSLATIELSMDKVREGADEYSKSLGAQADAQAAANERFSWFNDLAMSVGESLNGILPYINGASQALTSAATTAITMSAALQQLSKVSAVAAAQQKLCALAAAQWTKAAKLCTVSLTALRTSSHGAAVGAVALKVALRGLLICTGIGAVVAALTFGIEALIDALDDTEGAGKGAAKGLDASAEAARRAQEAFETASSQTFGNLMSRYAKLQAAWRALASEHQKKAWIADNRSELEQLGITINSTADAEAAFVSNTDSVVNSFKKKAKAAALMAQLTEEYNTQMRLADKIAVANEQANQRHKVKAGDEVKASSHTTEGGYEQVGSDGKWRYTEKGAARNNAQTWVANGRQTKGWRKALEESKARSGRLEAQIDGEAASAVAAPPKTAATTPKKAKTPTTKPAKEKAAPVDMEKLKFTPDTGGAGETLDTKQTESELKNLISYYEKQRSTLATTQEEYSQWTEKINAVKGSLDELQGVDPDTEGIEAVTESLGEMKAEGERAFDTISRGWGDIKGIGSSISAVSDVLEGNADAWTTITTVVDAALQMYQSVSGIISIIQALTGATQAQAVAETAETSATAAKASATTVDTVTTEANTAAALKNTAAKSGEAIAKATAGGASMPFPASIAAIAVGVAAVVAALAMIGSFSTGGIVGGNSPTGDKLMARVNSGEMILNRRQQQRLLDILNGKSLISSMTQRIVTSQVSEPLIDGADLAALEPREQSLNIHLKSRTRGTDIVHSVANTSRIKGASGHRTNIRI